MDELDFGDERGAEAGVLVDGGLAGRPSRYPTWEELDFAIQVSLHRDTVRLQRGTWLIVSEVSCIPFIPRPPTCVHARLPTL